MLLVECTRLCQRRHGMGIARRVPMPPSHQDIPLNSHVRPCLVSFQLWVLLVAKGAANSAMTPLPSTWFTVPSSRCTASIVWCRAGSRSCRAALEAKILDQCGGVFDVGQQDSHLLTFACQ